MLIFDVRVVAAELLIDRNGCGRIDDLGAYVDGAPAILLFPVQRPGTHHLPGLDYLDW